MSTDPNGFLTSFLSKMIGTRPSDPKLAAAYDTNLANNPFMKTAGNLLLQRASQTPDELNKELFAKGATQAQINELNNNVALARARGELGIRGDALKQEVNARSAIDTTAADNKIRTALRGQLPIMDAAQDHELVVIDRDRAEAQAYRDWASQEADKNRAMIAAAQPSGFQRTLGTILQGVGALAPLFLLRGLG